MILTLEGPDCSGKTTVFDAVRAQHPELAVYVPSVPVPPELRKMMPWIEQRQGLLWQYLHDPCRLYICDRHVAVSAPVYAQVHGRTFLCDVSVWRRHVHIAYFYVSSSVLEYRLRQRGDDTMDFEAIMRAKDAYASALSKYAGYRVLGGEDNIGTNVQKVVDYARFLRSENLCR